MNLPEWRLPDAPLRASAVTSTLIGLAALVALATAAKPISFDVTALLRNGASGIRHPEF